MPNQHPLISFNVDRWCAKSRGLHTPQDWITLSVTNQWPKEGDIEVNHIPAMMRRRMSSLSKLAVQCALELMKDQSIDYIVFSSRHGELHRSSALIKDIISGEDASPMAFSQSVHNTAAGLATIAAKRPIPVTSIAASDNTFNSAIIEAWSYLEEHPYHRVLLVDFDEPVPDVYAQFQEQEFNGYSIGLVLSHGNDTSFSIKQTTRPPHAQPQALDFLQHLLSQP
ncbi:3-oxoacyl-ACP synthase [Vibrio sp. 10N.286.49.C2]|uniref:beta-ketoacyl synthase chain length factor n=1 Tax=unclassified Vibrio TaxID=2614977 RepID=UPI000C84C1B3|nr:MULTISPECIES: beta-ketoacyl synthase chain length factor [unclassified Vibrio]PMH33816.1 3-oxoacyl-ACP synthase [Vibrio sp. 10N.286.49.C2]PMH44073.1 3-oxoacyl-ACP synthase [Vibrio sp. 10N.286.49.B1]PMH82963.1 3-oxoacyl-ACP synthase [Vibrio sp. 10N.286.48.B7]